MDISRPFGLRWDASCCLDFTAIARAFKEQGGTAFNYINDFRGVVTDEQMATQHFDMLHSLLEYLGLKEVLHKASAPGQAMTGLGLWFNMVDMMVSIPWEKM